MADTTDLKSELWRANNLQRHRTRTFKLAREPKFWDVIGLCLAPPLTDGIRRLPQRHF